jgi:hypothetical protein
LIVCCYLCLLPELSITQLAYPIYHHCILNSKQIHATPFKQSKLQSKLSKQNEQLPPHAYKTADEAYRAMMRGLETEVVMGSGKGSRPGSRGRGAHVS